MIVNVTELPANNASDRVDVGTQISEGENGSTVRLNSTLYGRAYAEHSSYQTGGAVYSTGSGIMDLPDPEAYYKKLPDLRIIPFTTC